MYRAIVARKIRRAWKRLDQGDYAYVLDQFAPGFEYHFVGDHALGGTRHSRPAMEAWFERLFGLFPGIRFELADVLVKGWPWNTTAVALIGVRAPVNGERYQNEVAQTIKIRWGRITSIRTLEDTQKLSGALSVLAETGSVEALEPAIVD